jgi:hypothetical protein
MRFLVVQHYLNEQHYLKAEKETIKLYELLGSKTSQSQQPRQCPPYSIFYPTFRTIAKGEAPPTKLRAVKTAANVAKPAYAGWKSQSA